MLFRIEPEVAKAHMKPKKSIALKQRKTWKRGTSIGLMSFIALFYLFPLLWLFDTSFRPKVEIFNTPPRILQAPPWETFKSYSLASFNLAVNRYQMNQGFLNSVLISACGILLTLLVCSLAAYAFALLRFKGRNFLFYCILATMMLPATTMLPPLFKVIQTYGLYNKHLGLILLYAASAFGVFLLRQYYVRLPISLIEAAVMDGASKFRIWWWIVLPLGKPALSALAIYQFRHIWNDFLVPMVLLRSRELHTLPIKLQVMDSVNVAKDYDAIIATGFIAITIPILFFLVFQRQFMEGLSGSLKE